MSSTYRIERSNNGTSGWADIATGITDLFKYLTGQDVNTTRYFRVYEQNNGYDIAVSNILKLPILSVPYLTVTGGDNVDRMRLSWTNVFASYYDVYKWNDGTSTWDKLIRTTINNYSDFAFLYNVTYWYFVVAITSDGSETDPSNTASGRITQGGVFTMANSRATVYQGIQMGWEADATHGTPATITRRIVGCEIIQTPNIPVKTVRHAGAKGITGIQKGDRYTEAKLNGALDFHLFAYLLGLGYGAPSASTIDTSVTAMMWKPSATAPLVPKAWTIEQGSSAGAEKFSFATLSDLSIKWSENDASLEASLFGQAQTRQATMTSGYKCTVSSDVTTPWTTIPVTVVDVHTGVAVASGTIPAGTYYIESPYSSLVDKTGAPGTAKIALIAAAPTTVTTGTATMTITALSGDLPKGSVFFTIPELLPVVVDPGSIGVFISTTGQTIGTPATTEGTPYTTSWTRLTDIIDGSISLGGLFKPSFHANETTNTFDRIVELNPNISASLTFEEGSNANDVMGYFDNGMKVWLGFKAIGYSMTATPTKYTIKLNIPFYVTKPDPGDKNDVYGNTFTFEGAHDQAFGMFEALVLSKLLTTEIPST